MSSSTSKKDAVDIFERTGFKNRFPNKTLVRKAVKNEILRTLLSSLAEEEIEEDPDDPEFVAELNARIRAARTALETDRGFPDDEEGAIAHGLYRDIKRDFHLKPAAVFVTDGPECVFDSTTEYSAGVKVIHCVEVYTGKKSERFGEYAHWFMEFEAADEFALELVLVAPDGKLTSRLDLFEFAANNSSCGME